MAVMAEYWKEEEYLPRGAGAGNPGHCRLDTGWIWALGWIGATESEDVLTALGTDKATAGCSEGSDKRLTVATMSAQQLRSQQMKVLFA